MKHWLIETISFMTSEFIFMLNRKKQLNVNVNQSLL